MSDHVQQSLFVDDLYVALTDVVRALGGYKTVGCRMRPELPADQAGRWLSDCLNRARRDKLDPDQLLYLLAEGRKAGIHVAMYFIAETAGYAQPEVEDPEDEYARLQRDFIASVGHQEQLLKRLERLAPNTGKNGRR